MMQIVEAPTHALCVLQAAQVHTYPNTYCACCTAHTETHIPTGTPCWNSFRGHWIPDQFGTVTKPNQTREENTVNHVSTNGKEQKSPTRREVI